jgi:hypothetical protein
MVLMLLTVLASNPSPPLQRTTVRAQLDVGDMLVASWYVPLGRARIEGALLQTRALLAGSRELNGQAFAQAAPIVGPWLATREAVDPLDRLMLVTSGILQTIGLGLGAARLFSETEAGVVETGPLVVFSPIAWGTLGFSVRVTGL